MYTHICKIHGIISYFSYITLKMLCLFMLHGITSVMCFHALVFFVPECTWDIFTLSEHLFLGPPLISDCSNWIHPLQLLSGSYCVRETEIVSDPDRKYSRIMVLPVRQPIRWQLGDIVARLDLWLPGRRLLCYWQGGSTMFTCVLGRLVRWCFSCRCS